MPHALHIPALPDLNHDVAWSANVIRAYGILDGAYSRAVLVLQEGEQDSHRLRLHADKIVRRSFPILDAMEREGMDQDWIRATGECLADVVITLENRAMEVENVHVAPVQRPAVIHVERTGRPGRPRKKISLEWLRDALSDNRSISLTRLAKAIGVHRHTLRSYAKACGTYRKFSDISDADLDLVIVTYRKAKPGSGIRYILGFFRSCGVRIQRERIRHSLRRVDGLAQALQNYEAVDDRRYLVPRSNYLWHLDGHHKLILWGFVIHGMIDGFDHTITGMRVHTDNKASTVLQLFLEAVIRFGFPSRLRGDRGGENLDVAICMIMFRGANRASFMWGSSHRNTRIERNWVEVGSQFARRWRAFFTRLGKIHHLDRFDPHHLWLLSVLFLDAINQDCADFVEAWNHHPISGPDTRNEAPLDIRFLSAHEHGIEEDQPNVHPNVLEQYYGAEGIPRHRNHGQTGAGHPEDENEDDAGHDSEGEYSEEIGAEERIAEDLEDNIRHEAIPAPPSSCPFSPNTSRLFFAALEEMRAANIVPDGYGVKPEEWDGTHYPVSETITFGVGGKKKLRVSLPADIWFPRAVLWVQALDLMQTVLIEEDDG